MGDGVLDSAQLAATVVLNLALAIAVGAWVQRLAPRRLLTVSALLALGASAVLLWLEAAAMADVPLDQAGSALGPLLVDTHYGRAWIVGACALVLVACASKGQGAWLRFAVALGLIGFACSRAAMGHAAAQSDAPWAVAIDAAHLLLMSLWVGEVFIAGFVTLPRPWPSDDAGARARARAAQVQALSTTATWALAGVILTGGLNAWHTLGSVSNLAGNAYGSMLLIKLAAVGAAVGLGGINRFSVMPALLDALDAGDATAPMRSFVRILRIEALTLFGVLVAAAVLSSSAPPAH